MLFGTGKAGLLVMNRVKAEVTLWAGCPYPTHMSLQGSLESSSFSSHLGFSLISFTTGGKT